MLAVVVAAALSPNFGVVQASSNCAYPPCSSSTPSTPAWVYGVIAAIVIVAALALAYVFMRRRRPPATAAPVQPWEGGPGPGAMPPAPPATPPTPPVPPAAAPAYLETPEDVGQAPQTVRARKAVGVGAGAAAAAAEEAEPDVDSIMPELD